MTTLTTTLTAETTVQLATARPGVDRGVALIAAAGDRARRPARVDANEVFHQLVREVDAGRTLIAMTPAGDRHRAAIDALQLARDVLADARDLFGPCACHTVTFTPAEDLGSAVVIGDTAHSTAVCRRIDPTTGEQL